MAAAVSGASNELPEATAADVADLTLSDLHRRLLDYARWKIDKASQAAVLMMRGYPHHEIREQLGLTKEQYRHVRRWLRLAMDADAEPLHPGSRR